MFSHSINEYRTLKKNHSVPRKVCNNFISLPKESRLRLHTRQQADPGTHLYGSVSDCREVVFEPSPC